MSTCGSRLLIVSRSCTIISCMKTKLYLLAIAWMAMVHQATAQDAFAFFRGEAFPPPRDTPAAWLNELHKADSLLNSNIAVAEFLPNTRIAWHHHPGGQLLFITDGVGYYQEKGKPKRIVRPGDVIECAPGVEHWHGASVESGLTYVAISPAQKGGTVWAQPVTDAEYASPATDRRTSAKLLKASETFPFDVASVAFAPGKQVAWRKNPGGEILIILEGAGYYQERDKPKQLLRRGDVIKTAAAVEHWYGAGSEVGLKHLSITPVAANR